MSQDAENRTSNPESRTKEDGRDRNKVGEQRVETGPAPRLKRESTYSWWITARPADRENV